jgi:hypothetical protein
VHESLALGYFPHKLKNSLGGVATDCTSASLDSGSAAQCLRCLHLRSAEDSLCSDVVSDKYLEEVIADLVMLLDLLDVGAHDGSFLLEDPDGAIDSHIHIVSLVEVLQGNGCLTFALLVEDHFIAACRVVDLVDGPHVLVVNLSDSSNDDDLTKLY